jgi:hypothetical protein
MRDIFTLFLHAIVTIIRLGKPGGRARFSSAICSKPPRINGIIRNREKIAFNMKAGSVVASLLKNQPSRNRFSAATVVVDLKHRVMNVIASRAT